ncbi:MAG: ABC transporter ATP-binding protein [Acidobacteria bacterium]|nr:ABC transporter ATP-binding protein [Acidobacteriota bacterium]
MAGLSRPGSPEPGALPGPGAVRCRGLVKRYGDVVAVAGLDLDIAPGECFGLLGPNGAGKTTTIEILEGLLEPDAGEVEILGRRWATDREALRQRLGIHLQESQFDDRLSVRETLDLFRSFYAAGQPVDDVLALLGLEGKASAWVSRLSGGQRQRMAIGCALVGKPDVLFLDEPTTGLDPQARRQVWEIVDGFRGRGGTVLLTTHYMDEAEVLSDRVAIVDSGRIIACGPPRELVSSLGAGHVIGFALDPAAASEPPDFGSRLEALPGARSARREAGEWSLTAASLHTAMPALLRLAADDGWSLSSLRTRTATLEDVFVSLTGRHLRDG